MEIQIRFLLPPTMVSMRSIRSLADVTSYTTANGLPHNEINDILVDREGIAWIATKTSGLISVNSSKQFLIEGKPNYEFVTLAEDDNGILWAGTETNGVFKFNNDSLGWYNADNGSSE